ncbi:MAG: hypothetical protein KAT46_06230 [Deltaproteobacteria bacterium]|nr:hypothetical protein [Deltaproteobacteria bacterium]
MSAIEEFSKEVFEKVSMHITDSVFLTIEKDRTLMKKYLQLVDDKGLNTVNQNLGKLIKKEYGLKDKPERVEKPQSVLIQSHQVF